MLIEKVFQAAEPLLKDRVVTDAVLGLSLTAVELDGTDIGLLISCATTCRLDVPPLVSHSILSVSLPLK